MNDMQRVFNAISESARETRKQYHLTLGVLASALQKMQADTPVVFDDNGSSPSTFNSYRGYYADLALDTAEAPMTAGKLLNECRSAIGETFVGWKGGDYSMGEDTPLWRASPGCCGDAIIDLRHENGVLRLVTKCVD